MRLPVLLALLAAAAPAAAVAQQPAAMATEAPTAKRTLREVWKMTEQEYLLVDPSRRRNGDTYAYQAARIPARGPHGNLIEQVPGGPVRPVSKPRETAAP
jgi:hypothetical protein